jgi:hypothetical protein
MCRSGTNLDSSSEAAFLGGQQRADDSKNNISSLDSQNSSVLLSSSMLSAGLDSSYISAELDFSLVRDVMYKYSKRT